LAAVGGVGAGLDDRDLDAEVRDLGGEGLAERLERPLRRVVDADVRERADPADARHLQDVARSLRAEVGHRGLGDEQGAEHVGVELRPGLGLGDLLDHAELAVAGIVDDDVEPAVAVVGVLHRGEDGVPVGDVELQRQDLVAEPLHEVVQRRGVAGGGGDRVLTLEGGDRPLAAEAAGRAGDEPGLRHARRQGGPREICSVRSGANRTPSLLATVD
jgi:hypothetical protein